MTQFYRSGLFAVLALFALTSASADVCSDLDGTADWWDEFAHRLDSVDESQLSEADRQSWNNAMTEGVSSTRQWADYFIRLGGDYESYIGTPLHASLTDLEEARDWDMVFSALDDIIDYLDAAAGACYGSVQKAPSPQGRIIVSYQAPPNDPAYIEMAQGLRESGVFEAIAEIVSQTVALPIDLPAVFATCGQANAFYDANSKRIVMCYEFFELFATAVIEQGLSDEAFAESILGAGAFFFLHEIGHALVDILEIPVTGREEDSVDSLAAIILIHGEGESALFAALDNFDAFARFSGEGAGGALHFWGEHSLNSQRLYDVACLLYGSNPQDFAYMVGEHGLPESRAVRCPSEFESKNDAWDTLLGPHFTD